MSTTIMRNGNVSRYSMLVISGGEHDGAKAESLRRLVLHRELARMGVRSIDDTMGKMALLEAFRVQVETAAAALRAPGARPMPLGEIVAKQAADIIANGGTGGDVAKGARAIFGAPNEPRRPPAPRFPAPIASTNTRGTP